MNMKKIFCLIQVIALFVCLCAPMSAHADFSNSYVGTVKKGTLVTYINNYPIPSYVLNGYTFIQVEDLNHYGFDVIWNEYDKSLRIIRNDSTNIDPLVTFLPHSSEIGTKDFDMYTTEVTTYIGNYGYEIECYGGLPGCTYINIDNLSAFGQVQWVAELNQMKVWIKDGLECWDTPFPVRETILDLPCYKHIFMPGNNIKNYYEFSHFIGNNSVSFWYGEYSKQNDKTVSWTFCPSSRLYVDIFNVDGKKVFTTSQSYWSTKDMTYVPYLLNLTDAPASCEVSVSIHNLSYNNAYMAKLTFWCSHCDYGKIEEIYFSL